MTVQFDRAISSISVTLESANQINDLEFQSAVLRPPSLPLAARAPTLRPAPHPATRISCNERLNRSCDREEGDQWIGSDDGLRTACRPFGGTCRVTDGRRIILCTQVDVGHCLEAVSSLSTAPSCARLSRPVPFMNTTIARRYDASPSIRRPPANFP
jgi:hypothetical protein